jgi:hypothetical protein
MQIQQPRAASLLLSLILLTSAVVGCTPKASSTPLGLGPLAVAERAAATQKKPAAPARRSAVAPAPNSPSTEAAPAGETALAEGATPKDESSESSAAEPKSGAKAAPAFAGLFAGKDVAIYRIAGMAERQELDDKAQIRIESDSPTQLRIVLINSENGSDLCDLSAEVQGNSAVLDGGQPCFGSEGEGAIHAELTSGTVVLSGDRLSMNAEGTLSVALAEEELDGDLSYSFKGKRQ